MSFLKKLFGKSSNEKDNQVEESVASIKVGNIDKVYPVLKPGDWVGIKAGAIRETLLGTPEAPILVAGFAYNTPDNFTFLTAKDVAEKDSARIVETAYTNLEMIPVEFTVVEQLGGILLTASGNDFSSEKIFIKAHMLKAHQLLDADELLVSIPRRRCMLVVAKKADQKLLDLFVALHKKAWQEDKYGNAPIINALFLVKDGLVSNVIRLD